MFAQNPKNFARRSYLLLLLIGAMAIFSVLGVSLALTNQIDSRAQNDARERFSLVLTEWKGSLKLAVEDYSYWTLAYEYIVGGDEDVIYNNIGSGATQSELFDWIVIFDVDPAVQYTFGLPEGVDVESVLSRVKLSRLLGMMGENEPIAYKTISGAVKMGDEVALVSAARVIPDAMVGTDPAPLPVMIGGVTLNEKRMARLKQSTGAEAIDIVARPIKDSEIAYDFDGPFGITGHLSLTPKTPGRDFLMEVLPVLLIFCAAVVSIILLIASHFKYFVAQLDKAIVLASTDPLTGLSNRAALQGFIESPAIRQALELGGIAVISLDLNRFKQLNDQHGHAVGDIALQITAKRLQNAVRVGDRVIRLGGDEFLCLIVDKDPELAPSKVAERIVSLFEEPVDLGAVKSKMQVSIGVAVGGAEDGWCDLLRRADAAMYKAKRNGDVRPMFHQVGARNLRLGLHHPRQKKLRGA